MENEGSRKDKAFSLESCTNSLPTKENLMKRKILQESVCHRRSRDSEDVLHALWGCESLKVIWESECSWVDKFRASLGSFSDLFQKIQEKPTFLPLFATTAWSVWFQCNNSRL